MDALILTKNLGHEKSEHLKKAVFEIIESAKLKMEKVIVISRDNPNVVK